MLGNRIQRALLLIEAHGLARKVEAFFTGNLGDGTSGGEVAAWRLATFVTLDKATYPLRIRKCPVAFIGLSSGRMTS